MIQSPYEIQLALDEYLWMSGGSGLQYHVRLEREDVIYAAWTIKI